MTLMPLPALQKFEKKIGRQLRLLEVRKNIIERKIERQFRLFEQRRDGIGKEIDRAIKQFERNKGIRLDDEVRFIRSWIERPLTVGAVTPSGKILARAMARYVDPNSTGPVVELGPGTGPVTEALVEAGVDPSRLVLVEFNPSFCKILRSRYPDATLVQGDAYSMRRLLETLLVPARRRRGVRPAADHQADQDALAAHSRRFRSDGARRAFRAIHLFGRFAGAEAVRRLHGGGLRAHLDEYSARARMGVSEDLGSAVIIRESG